MKFDPYNRRTDWQTVAAYAGAGLFLIALCVAIVCGVLRHQHWVEHCENNGGHIAEVNCTTSTRCTSTMWSKYQTTTECHPVTSCDEVCEGANAEAGQ